MKFKVLRPIMVRDTTDVIKPGAIWDDEDQRTPYERDLLVAMGVLERLDETDTAHEPPVQQQPSTAQQTPLKGKEKTR